MKEALLSGEFPSNIQEQFRTLLEYYGQSPVIVRSSSFLEDGFGNAFAGKYESVFCVNQGTPDERLHAFEDAVRTVYASTMDISALEYRKIQGLDHHDEQMAVLAQRVSGSYHGSYFFPSAAGVGYSRSFYKLDKNMDPSAGLLRIVTGLGTRAVDRTENDYPRLVNLDRPSVSMYGSLEAWQNGTDSPSETWMFWILKTILCAPFRLTASWISFLSGSKKPSWNGTMKLKIL